MRPPRPAAVAASSVFAAFGAILLVTGLTRPGAPPVRAETRWVPAEALVEVPDSTAAGTPSASSSPAHPAASPDDRVPAPAAVAARGPDQGGPGQVAPGQVAVPVSLEIPRIGLRTALGAVGRDASGAIAVPAPGADGGRRAFWYRELARPGAVGPAVIVGHVDSRADGPAVFFRLGELAPGDEVTVGRADGSSVRFVVRALGRYPKTAFPSDAVYGPTSTPTLRLITCGGGFDSRHGSYLDNLVVFAAAAGA